MANPSGPFGREELIDMQIVSIGTSDVEYGLEEAAIDIDKLIAALQKAKEEFGATHVVGTSGNYRGAQWVRINPDFEAEDG